MMVALILNIHLWKVLKICSNNAQVYVLQEKIANENFTLC